MKTIKTSLGKVKIFNASMKKASGYGQYTILLEVFFEGNKIVSLHSTDSQLFDKLTDLDNNDERSKYLLTNQSYLIEREVSDYINSL